MGLSAASKAAFLLLLLKVVSAVSADLYDDSNHSRIRHNHKHLEPAVNLTLIRTSNNRHLLALDDDSVIDLATTPRHTILAESTLVDGATVEFVYDGVAERTEATVPFLITAVQPNGKPKPFKMRPGIHRLEATVIVKQIAVASHAVQFRVINSSTRTNVSLILVNAKTNKDIGPLLGGDQIDRTLAGSELTVRAKTDRAVDKMKFYHDGRLVRSDKHPPYSLGGGRARKYAPYRPMAAAGNHRIRAVAILGDKNVGSVRVDFVVKPDCSTVKCAMEIKCEFGYESVVTPGECCPVCQLKSNCREVQCLTTPCPPICKADCLLVLCPEVLCPIRYNPVIPDGECCPTCEQDCSTVKCTKEIQCDYGYESVVPPGECCPLCQLKQECKQPLCKRGGSCPAICKVNCSLVLCPAVICNAGFRPVTPDGECCPTCEPDCATVKCAIKIECDLGYESVVPPDKCCPFCRLKPECKQPLCKRGRECPAICNVDCSMAFCPRVACRPGYHAVTPVGACCPMCEPDCSTVKCAKAIPCAYGYESIVPPGECCPVCQLKAGCKQPKCYECPAVCKADCSLVLCPLIKCSNGYQSVTPDGECCPTCEQTTNNTPGRQLEDSGPTIDLFLIRTSDDRRLFALDDDFVIDLATTPRHTIVAETLVDGAMVEFAYDGVSVRNEATAPYLIAGRQQNGKPKRFQMSLGFHSVSVTALLGGSAVARTAVNFTVIDTSTEEPSLSFTLVNAKTNKDIGRLLDGTEVDLSIVGSKLTVRADFTLQQIPSKVTFYFDSKRVRVEKNAPYVLSGTKSEANYRRFNRMTNVGPHSIQVIARLGGEQVGNARVDFVVTDVTTSPTPSPIAPDPYNIQRQLVGVPSSHIEFFEKASARWESVFTEGVEDRFETLSGVPPNVDGCTFPNYIDDLYICAGYQDLSDGVGGTLGFAGPSHADRASGRAIAGTMVFDAVDATGDYKDRMEAIVLHEMGHVLGIGTLWSYNSLTGSDESDCPYHGVNANAEYGKISQCDNAVVPTELGGGPGTRCGHFDEECLQNELMTGFIDDNMALSRITLGSLNDIGYSVDYSAADAFGSDDLGVCPPCPTNNRELLSMLDQPHGKTRQLGLRHTQQPRKLSDSMRQYAINAGRSILKKNKAITVLNLKSSLEMDALTPAHSTNVQYVGDKVISVIVADGGDVFNVIVKSDDV